jgi:hypothetical protein
VCSIDLRVQPCKMIPRVCLSTPFDLGFLGGLFHISHGCPIRPSSALFMLLNALYISALIGRYSDAIVSGNGHDVASFEVLCELGNG